MCDRHPVGDYATLKKTCDAYFYIKHRQEMRGVGGIFFDELSPVGEGDWETDFAYVEDGVRTLLPSYLPILKAPYGILLTVSVNGSGNSTVAGATSNLTSSMTAAPRSACRRAAHIEAILMSMPPYAHWAFDYRPEPGTPEAKMLSFLQPRDWVSEPQKV